MKIVVNGWERIYEKCYVKFRDNASMVTEIITKLHVLSYQPVYHYQMFSNGWRNFASKGYILRTYLTSLQLVTGTVWRR